MNKYKSIETILQCPITKEGLVFVESVRNTDTHTDISSLQEFESGFLNTSRTIFYPLIHGIIFLMPEYCISNVKYTSDKMILSVQEFYNTFGWTKTEAGNYIDEVIFTDHRDIARDYKVHYAERIAPLFKKEGKYLLDIASGPVYQEPYKRYSDYCEYRICIDISVEALKDAQKNLDINGPSLSLGILQTSRSKTVVATISYLTIPYIMFQNICN